MSNNVMVSEQVVDILVAVGLDKPNIGLLDDVAHELTDNLRKYKYPPDIADDAVQLVFSQAEALGEEWV